ncbi:MAG: SDR family oxidoreductase [Desulfovibrio sp.]
MGRILVTGATGNVGGAALKALLDKGADVVAAVHDPAGADALRAAGAEVRHMDLADPESMAQALEGVERLFFILPLHEEMRRWGSGLVHAAREAGVSLIVRSSSMGADANAHYQLGKLHGGVDAEIEASGIPHVVLRPCTFMQNYLALGPLLRETGVLPVPEGKGRSSFVDARDVGACAAEALLRPDEFVGTILMVTGPEALDNYQVAEILSDASGREIAYREGDIEEMGMFLEGTGLSEWCVHMILSVHRYARNGYTSFATKAVEHMLGRPAMSFAAFAREHAAAWR